MSRYQGQMYANSQGGYGAGSNILPHSQSPASSVSTFARQAEPPQLGNSRRGPPSGQRNVGATYYQPTAGNPLNGGYRDYEAQSSQVNAQRGRRQSPFGTTAQYAVPSQHPSVPVPSGMPVTQQAQQSNIAYGQGSSYVQPHYSPQHQAAASLSRIVGREVAYEPQASRDGVQMGPPEINRQQHARHDRYEPSAPTGGNHRGTCRDYEARYVQGDAVDAAMNGSRPSGASNTNPRTGYRNVRSRTRAERKVLQDKELLEKSRLAQRREGHERPNVEYSGANMVTFDPSSAGYLSNADRFHTDTAGEEKQRRDIQLQRREHFLDEKRRVRVENERLRQEELEMRTNQEQQRYSDWRAAGKKAQANNPSVPFDLVSLQYQDGKDGDRLRYADEKIKHRAARRAQTLQKHTTGDGYNPITGSAISLMQVGPSPRPPTGL